MKRKQKGKVKLPKGQEGIFNDCWVSPEYSEYSYVPGRKGDQIDHYDYVEGTNMSIVELIRKLLASHTDLQVANGFQKIKADEFLTQLRRGLTISLKHDYFKSMELRIDRNVIKMRLNHMSSITTYPDGEPNA